MVQPDQNPSPDDQFHQGGAERSDAGLEGVVEELKNVLAGLTEEQEVKRPAEPSRQAPPPVEVPFSFDEPAQPAEPPLQDVATRAEERGPLQEEPPPSDAEFWNGNVLGWSDKEPPPPPPAAIEEEVIIQEPQQIFEEPPPAKPAPSLEALLPPLPPSPFDVDAQAAASGAAAVPVEPIPSASPVPPPAIPERPAMETVHMPPTISPFNDDPVDNELVDEKTDGVIQVACFYPKGLEKQGQHFVSSLRGACEKARLPISVQAVYIQPWSAGLVDLPTWAKTARKAGAERMYVLTGKQDQAPFKNLPAAANAMGLKSRLILLEHVGLRTLYADILVELRRR